MVTTIQGSQAARSSAFRLVRMRRRCAGVISGYRTEKQPVYAGSIVLSDLTAVANTGIVVASSIQHVTHAINAK